MTNPIVPSAGAPPAARAASNPPSVPRMSDLLRRYPNIAEEERLQLLDFLTTGAQEDIVAASYAVGLEPRLDAFRKDHPEHFPGMRAWVPFAVLVLVILLGIAWRLLA